ELLNKPFKELTKEERILVSRARSRAMRAKAGVPVASKIEGAVAAARTEETAAPAEAPAERPRPAAPAAASAADVADPLAAAPSAKPFNATPSEDRTTAPGARSGAMRAKAGLPGAGQGQTAAPEADEEPEPEPVVAVSVDAAAPNGEAADPMAEVPPELLAKPFKDLTKEERIIVSRARSRAMRAKVGKAVSSKEW